MKLILFKKSLTVLCVCAARSCIVVVLYGCVRRLCIVCVEYVCTLRFCLTVVQWVSTLWFYIRVFFLYDALWLFSIVVQKSCLLCLWIMASLYIWRRLHLLVHCSLQRLCDINWDGKLIIREEWQNIWKE